MVDGVTTHENTLCKELRNEEKKDGRKGRTRILASEFCGFLNTIISIIEGSDIIDTIHDQ